MESEIYKKHLITELAFKAFDGVIAPEERTKLNALLREDLELQDYYIELVRLCSTVSRFSDSGIDINHGSEVEIENFEEAMMALAENEKTAPGVLVEKPTEKPVELMPGLLKTVKLERKISRLAIYTLALSTAAMLFLMILVLSSPIRPIVATLTDSINAEWISEDEIPTDGDPLRQGQLTLARGLAEITFYDGAVVVVEAPAVIELESPKSMFLTSGKISAVVSKYATGFTVNTRSASIVDLGTEFSVSVVDDGSCSLHMFKGMASLIAGQKSKIRTSHIVNADEARSIDEVTGVVKEIELLEKAFVRHIDSEEDFIWRGERLDLADFVGNGNGFGTGSIGAGIALNNGSYINIAGPSAYVGKHQYKTASWSNVIDGVFIPDGEMENTVSSLGHKFAGFPATNNFAILPVMNGIKLRQQQGYGISLLNVGVKLDSIVRGTRENPAIIMHSNSGITFDLDRIRAILPGVKIAAFRFKCGISETVIEYGENKNPHADFWVLLDGEKSFELKGATPTDETKDVNIPISESQRFLTLATTDGGDEMQTDWCLFADPILELEL